MNQKTVHILFSLLRSAIFDTRLTDRERAELTSERLSELIKLSKTHDVSHLLALGLKKNELVPKQSVGAEKSIFTAIYRFEQLEHECENLFGALETAQIPFLPLKGAIMRRYYPEAWMRTSCDVDVLIHRENLESAIAYLVQNLNYVENERATHDVSLLTPCGICVELHFDLVEEGRANNAITVLSSVWEHAALRENYNYWYEMSDAFFYFYHIAHMAKHFETGGCGVRPFIDLFILDRIVGANEDARNELLERGNLLQFSRVARQLSEAWFGEDGDEDPLVLKMQNFILQGGVYGSADNRVALQQQRRGGRIGYIFSRIFLPYAKLKRYYPILEKHRWLMPFMQIRRWFMLLRPDVAKMARRELKANSNIEKSRADEMSELLEHIGL